jgi:hypothetical protein
MEDNRLSELPTEFASMSNMEYFGLLSRIEDRFRSSTLPATNMSNSRQHGVVVSLATEFGALTSLNRL